MFLIQNVWIPCRVKFIILIILTAGCSRILKKMTFINVFYHACCMTLVVILASEVSKLKMRFTVLYYTFYSRYVLLLLLILPMDVSLVSLVLSIFLFSLKRYNNIISLMASWNPWNFPEPQTWLSKHSHKCSLVTNKLFPASALDPNFYRQLQDQIVTRNKIFSKTGCGYLCLWISSEKTHASQQLNR